MKKVFWEISTKQTTKVLPVILFSKLDSHLCSQGKVHGLPKVIIFGALGGPGAKMVPKAPMMAPKIVPDFLLFSCEGFGTHVGFLLTV